MTVESRLIRSTCGATLPARGACAVALVCLAVCAGGCGGRRGGGDTAGPGEGKQSKLNLWLVTQPLDVPAAVYRIQSPDVLVIHAPRIKEVDTQRCSVRPDGKITVNLLGEVPVNDLTPAEVSELLAQKLRTYYSNDSLDINVQVTEFKSKSVMVMGQVLEPGIKPFTGRNTVLSVLAEAKLNEDAWPEKIVVVRPHEDPTVKQRVTVDVQQMFDHGIVGQNFLLEAGDLVYVPRSPLSEFNLRFNRLLFPIRPATDLLIMGMTGI